MTKREGDFWRIPAALLLAVAAIPVYWVSAAKTCYKQRQGCLNKARYVLAACIFLGFVGSASGSSATPASSCVMGFHFNDTSGPANDFCGSFDASFNGNPATGAVGQSKPNGDWPDTKAFKYDGNGDYLSTPIPSGVTSGGYSISSWVYLADESNNHGVSSYRDTSSGDTAFTLFYNSGNNGGSFQCQAKDNSFGFVNTPSVSKGQWYHVGCAVKADGSNISIYLNGQLEASTSGHDGVKIPDDHRIGDLAGGGAPMNGRIDEHKEYNKFLNGTEFNNLFNFNTLSGFTQSNAPPSVDSNSVSPDPPEIGNQVSYDADFRDTDGTIQNASLKVFDDGSQVFSTTDTSVSGSTVNKSFSNVATPTAGDFDAEFTVFDNSSAKTTAFLNRTLTESAPASPTVNQPTGTFNKETINYDVATSSDNDDKPGESLTVTIKEDGTQVDTQTVTEGSTATGSYVTSGGGSHTFKAEVKEADGQTASTTSSYTVDFIEPTVDSTSISPSNLSFGDSVNATVSASDNTEISEIKAEAIRDSTILNTSTKTFSTASVTTTFTDLFTANNAGTFKVNFTVTDNQNLTGTASVNAGTLTENAPAALTVNEPNGTFNTNIITYNVSTSDDADDKTGESLTFNITEDGAQVDTQTITEGQTATGSYQTSTSGSHTFKAVAKESDGENVSANSTYTVSNFAPSASLSTNTTSIQAGETVSFDASGSSDSDGTISSFDYDFDGDGTFDSLSAGSTTQNTFSSGGTFTSTVRVTDDDGATNTATETITVTDNPPTIQSLSFNPSGFQKGDDVDVSFNATDDNGFNNITLEVDRDGTTLNTKSFQPSATQFQTTQTNFFSATSNGTYTATLTVEDTATQTNTQTTQNTVGSTGTGGDTTTTTTSISSSGLIVIAFALITGVFAYLAINTPQANSELRVLNYLMTYISIFFTGYLAFSSVSSGTDITDILTPWVNTFYAPMALVFAYFFIKMMATVLDEFDVA